MSCCSKTIDNVPEDDGTIIGDLTLPGDLILPLDGEINNGASESIAFGDNSLSMTVDNFNLFSTTGEQTIFNMGSNKNVIWQTTGNNAGFNIRQGTGSNYGSVITQKNGSATSAQLQFYNYSPIMGATAEAFTFFGTNGAIICMDNDGRLRVPSGSIELNGGSLLDTFVESTWTPTIGDGVNNFTTSVSSGNYQQVGSWIHFNFLVTWTAKAPAAGAIKISLPVNANDGVCSITNHNTLTYAAGDEKVVGECKAGSIDLYFLQSNASRTSTLAADFGITGSLSGSGSYLIQ